MINRVTIRESSPESTDFISKYGNRVIVVSKAFTSLSKKMQLILVEREVAIMNDIPANFVPGIEGISSSRLDHITAAQLKVMEKYGYRKVKKVVMKEAKFNIVAHKAAGRYLYKTHKKAAKNATPATAETELKEPALFKDVPPAPEAQPTV
jgi:hypothetical protein